jgi:glyoxylase-like metal-dependent hydrolase (beta-lactamase superfamily II)
VPAVLSIETLLKFADHCVQERFGVSEYSRSSSDESDYMASTDERDSPPSTSFVTRRVNASTFLVIEDDVYGEQPYIYVKIYDQYLLLTDTGCNSPRSEEPSLTSLRQFLETYPVSQNKDRCLNPNGIKKYVLICSHCHYDHILGIPQFLSTNPTIIASDFNKSFLLEDLDQHSLCKYVNAPTPEYEIAHWASHMSYFSLSGIPFRIQFLHVPGHTPDSLAFYDLDEHHIYVGDTFYERKRWKPIPELPDDAGQVPGLPATQAAIIFPEEGGNWIQYMASLDMLLSFVMHQNMELRRQHGFRHESPPRVKVGCGHLTYEGDAETMIVEVRGLFERIIAGKIPVSGSGEKRGIIHDFWLENENARYSVMAPRHLAQEAARHFHPDMTHGP